jgi:hypothetical protein
MDRRGKFLKISKKLGRRGYYRPCEETRDPKMGSGSRGNGVKTQPRRQKW